MFRPKRLKTDNESADAPSTALIPWSAILWVLGFSVLTALLLPRHSPFPYRYAVGQPWSYRTLNAPFDFEVMRPEEEVKDALMTVNAEHGPYLELDPHIADAGIRQFEELLDKQIRISSHDAQYEDLNNNADQYRRFGRQLLSDLFRQGIAPETAEFVPKLGLNSNVFVVDGETERSIPFSSLLTVKKAQDFLIDTLPYSPVRQPEILLPMLEKVLAPNLVYSDSLTEASRRRKIAGVVSTGIVVTRGEAIVEHDALVSPETYQKLQSLSKRYETPGGWAQHFGYALLALLAFAAIRLLTAIQPPMETPARERRLLLPVLIVACIALIGFANRFGAAVPLLLPMFLVPVALNRMYSLNINLAVWAAITVLCGIAMEWGAAWMLIQLAGVAATVLFLLNAESWPGRIAGIAVVVFCEILAWVGAGLAGRLPDAVWNSDTVLFFGAAGVLGVLGLVLKGVSVSLK